MTAAAFSPIIQAYMAKVGVEAVKRGIDWGAMSEEERMKFASDYCKGISRNNEEKSESQRREEERARSLERQRRIESELMRLEREIPPKYIGARTTDFSDKNPVIPHILGGGSCLLTGVPGLGKTHMIWAVARAMVERGEKLDEIKVINLQDLVCDIKENGKSNWARYTKQAYGNYKHLFIDEFDKVYGGISDYTIISDLVSYRYDNLLPTVIAGNGERQIALDILGGAVYSRLTGKADGGAYFPIGGEDRRSR